jgi:hypothetical protein
MNSYNIKSLSRIQQYLASLHMKYYTTHTATRTSEPSSTYDAVIIGGGMNIHVNLQLSILVFYKLPCMALDTVTRRKIAQCAVTWNGRCNAKLTKSKFRPMCVFQGCNINYQINALPR